MFKKLHIQSTQITRIPSGLDKALENRHQNFYEISEHCYLSWTFCEQLFLFLFKNLCLNQYGPNPSSAQDILDLDLFLYQDKSFHSVMSTFDLYSQKQVALFYLVALGLNKFIMFPPYFFIVR